MSKGYVFTLDALIAVILAGVFFAAFASILNQKNPLQEQELALNLGNDLLSSLQQSGTLRKYLEIGEGEVENKMEKNLELLPEQYCANFTISKYKSEGTSFTLEKTFNAKTNCSSSEERARAKRMFSSFKKQRLGTAELDLWVR